MAEKSSNEGKASVQQLVFTANGSFQPAKGDQKLARAQQARLAAVKESLVGHLKPPQLKRHPQTMKAFQRRVWGSAERITELKTILRHRAISENVILTRGVCREVIYALGWTPFLHGSADPKQDPAFDLRPCFSYCLDTQGQKGTFHPENKTWVFSKVDVKLHKRPNFQHEIAKDRYIANVYAQPGMGKVFYVDDSPEVTDIARVPAVEVVALGHEEVDGITATSNTVQREAMIKSLDALASEGKQATVIWDFDCTLSSIHLYKTWTCAKTPNMQIKRSFAKWDLILSQFLDERAREVIRLEDEQSGASTS